MRQRCSRDQAGTVGSNCVRFPPLHRSVVETVRQGSSATGGIRNEGTIDPNLGACPRVPCQGENKMTKPLCPICGKGQLSEQVGDFNAKLPDEGGKLRDLVVPGVSWLHCESCNEDILDETAEMSISVAQRAMLGLLSADQIR